MKIDIPTEGSNLINNELKSGMYIYYKLYAFW